MIIDFVDPSVGQYNYISIGVNLTALKFQFSMYDCSHDSPCHLLVSLLALVRVGVGGTPDRPQGEEADLRDGPPLRHRVQRVQQLLGADARENLYIHFSGRTCCAGKSFVSSFKPVAK